MRLLYSDGGLLGWHSPLIAPTQAPAGDLVAECHVTGSLEGRSLKRLLFYETVRERLIEKMRKEAHVDEESLEPLAEVHREYCHAVSSRGYFRTRIAVERLSEGTFLMTMENHPLYYSPDSLPEVQLTVPHERLRSLVINEDDMLSTDQASSYIFFVRTGCPTGEETLIQLRDHSCSNLWVEGFLAEAETARTHTSIPSYLSRRAF